MSNFDTGLFGVVTAVALTIPATVVVAAEYLSIEAAQRAVFPEADAYEPVVLSLSSADREAILSRAGAQPGHGTLRVYRAYRQGESLGYVFVDEVIGRSELITYATGIDMHGALRQVEVLAYRESHGAEIRNPAWRRQFANRSGLSELVFRTDIKNISGATLSSEHVTQGVRWLVALWETALRPPPNT
jgi:hypothetical protein